MRTLLACAALVLVMRIATARAAEAGAAVRPPNILLFVSDDQGQEFAGCYGNKVIHAPHMDALATEGMRFTRAFAASPTCTPSRSSLYTGLYPPRTGAEGNHTNCKPGLHSLPTYLKKLGYRVVLANKSDVRPPEVFDFEMLKATLPRNPDGPLRRYRAEGLDTKAVDVFLTDYAKDGSRQPLCLVVGDSSPHVVWEYNRTYEPTDLPIPANMVDTPVTREALARYYQECTTADRNLGAVLDSLKRNGLDENTLVIYTSDQGAEWPHCKWTLYDTGLMVPFIVRWPGKIAPGSVSDAMISFVDVAPTLVDVAGGQPVENLDGRSFKGVLEGASTTFRDLIFGTHTGDGQMNMFPQRGARDPRYKYILNLKPENLWETHFTKVPGIPGSHKQAWDTWVEKARSNPEAAQLVNTIVHHPAEELYDTQTDPYELTNLATHPEMQPALQRLRRELQQWRVQMGEIPAAR